jgi:hypothetical protein
LVVISAVGKSDIALKAWNKLIQLWDVEELDSISLRFLPAVYVNIGHLYNDLNPKLLGKYRYNSVRNIQRLRSLKPIIGKFDTLSIDYRFVKGFAISLRMKTLGYRIMGDVDIVIRRGDLKNVLRIFSDFGYADKFYTDCEKYTVSNKQEKYTLIADNGTEIDLHVAENAFPSKVFKKMFQEKETRIPWEGIFIKIPSDQLLISHSLLHGLQGVSVTDRWQTLVDVNTLENVRKSNKHWKFSSLSKRIANAFDDDSKIFSAANVDHFEFAFKAKSLTSYYWINKLLSHRFTVQSSDTRGIALLFSNNRYSIRSLSYSTWYFLAARSLLERIACTLLGGFLNRPKSTIQSGHGYLPIQEVDKFSVLHNIFDYRFRIQCSSRVSKLDIHFESEVFRKKNYEVFCNGKLVGVSNKSGVFGVSYFDKVRDFEISIRNPSHACYGCFETLENLKVRFEYEDLI